MATAPHERPQVRSPADVANLLMLEMGLLEQEHLRAVLLDTKNVVLRVANVYAGNLNTAVVRVGEVFREAIRANCASIIVVHNHPSGDPTPSPEDVRVTEQLVEAGRLLDIDVLDHLVIGRNRYVSLKERGSGLPLGRIHTRTQGIGRVTASPSPCSYGHLIAKLHFVRHDMRPE